MIKLRMTDKDYNQLNPPPVIVRTIGNELYEKMIVDERWIRIGYIPAPRTSFGWFVYHIFHGLAMRYPLIPVLVFAFESLRSERNGTR